MDESNIEEGRRGELVDKAKAVLISASLDIIENINEGKSQLNEKAKAAASIFYAQEILNILPNEIDALCLTPGVTIFRENGEAEKPLVWQGGEVREYLKKLQEGEIWE